MAMTKAKKGKREMSTVSSIDSTCVLLPCVMSTLFCGGVGGMGRGSAKCEDDKIVLADGWLRGRRRLRGGKASVVWFEEHSGGKEKDQCVDVTVTW